MIFMKPESILKNISLALLFILLGVGILRMPWWVVNALHHWGPLGIYLETLLFIILHAANILILLVMAKLMTAYVDRVSLSDVYIRVNGRQFKLFALGFVIAAMASVAVAVLYYLIHHPNYMLRLNNPFAIIMVVVMVFMATSFQAGTEEIWVRSYALKHLGEVVSPKWAVILIAVGFSMLHFLNPHCNIMAVINCFFSGIMMGMAVIYTRSILMAVGLHAGWNMTSSLLFHGRIFSVVDSNGNVLTIFNAAEGSLIGCIVVGITTILVILVVMKLKALWLRAKTY